MKSKTSLFNKAVWKRNLTGCFGLWAGLSVLYLFLFPVFIYANIAESARYADIENVASLRSINMVGWIWQMSNFVLIFAVAALVTAMFLFSYLFTARNANMMHTYPVDRMSLFATNYISGLVFLLVPLLVSALLSLLVGAAYGAVTGEVIKSFLIWMGAVSVINIFFFSLSVCVLMFVGNIVAVPVLYVILNFLYSGIMMTIEWMVNAVSYGISAFTIYTPLGRILTPVYALMHLKLYIGTGEDWKMEYSFEGVKLLLIYLAASVVLTAAAVIAYRKKHIETAGDVITVNWLKPVFRWGVAVCTSAVGAMFVSSIFFEESFGVILFSVIIIGVAVFFIAQMLLDRSVHVFSKKRGRECLVYTVIICAVYLGLDADVFGMERKIPQADEIKTVWVSGRMELYAEDAEEISWVQDIHKQIIDSKKKFEQAGKNARQSGTAVFSYISFDYRMKDGSRLRRSYQIPETDEAESVYGQIEDYASRADVILRRYFGIHYPEVEVFGGVWESDDDRDSNGNSYDIRISETDAKRLYQAVIKDAEEGSFYKDSEITEEYYYGYLSLDVRDEAGFITPVNESSAIWTEKEGSADIYVDSSLVNLVREMKELGLITDDAD